MNIRYRKTIVAGNWKMNKSIADIRDYIAQLKPFAARAKWCELVLCVPFTHIPAAVKAAKGTRIDIGAQNCHFEASGAFTGEISCDMLVELGVKYVIIGHSERRQYFGETDSSVNQKVRAAIEAGLRPIVCVGESAEIRQAGATLEHVACQVKAALAGMDAASLRKVVIAYEPIWAIGTGNTATAIQAQEAQEEIRRILRIKYGARAARGVSILYGGSMNSGNAAGLLAQPDVDGGLIGNASLEPQSLGIIAEAAEQ